MFKNIREIHFSHNRPRQVNVGVIWEKVVCGTMRDGKIVLL